MEVAEDQKRYGKLNDVEAYKRAYVLSNEVWAAIVKWDYFAQDTIGKQMVRAVDSVSANVAEGYGRHGKKDKIRFYRIAKGSAYEALDWNQKALARGLFSAEIHTRFLDDLQVLIRLLNTHIRYTNNNLPA